MKDKSKPLKNIFLNLDELGNKNSSGLKASKFKISDSELEKNVKKYSNPSTSLKDVFNHVAKGKRGPAPRFVPPAPQAFDPADIEMKTKRRITAPKTAKWRKKGRGAKPDAKSKQGKDRRGGGKPPGG